MNKTVHLLYRDIQNSIHKVMAHMGSGIHFRFVVVVLLKFDKLDLIDGSSIGKTYVVEVYILRKDLLYIEVNNYILDCD